MKRIGYAALALGVLASQAPLSGTGAAQTRMDCSRMYKEFWGRLDREKLAKIPAEKLAAVSRLALRAYDACQAGDDMDGKAQFDRLYKLSFWS